MRGDRKETSLYSALRIPNSALRWFRTPHSAFRIGLFRISLSLNPQLSTIDHQLKMKRTTHRSSKGTKLYAVRDKSGKFKNIQTYKRAHGQDIKRKSKAEKKA
jgi:hypothetical protein